MIKATILSISMLLAAQAHAGYFLPLNDLKIPATSKGLSGINEVMFNKVIDHIESIYAPILKGIGKKLVIERRWSDPTVNAYAKRVGKNTYHVAMFGGLARHEETTADGFAMVVCHEIGHHIGGAARYGKNTQWASTEGQSDYWATSKCAKRIYKGTDNWGVMGRRFQKYKSLNGFARSNSTLHNDYAFEKCSQVFQKKDEIAICVRTALGGLSLARLLSSLRKDKVKPEFQTVDTKVVKTTYERHPDAQCRLDTYFSGALCVVDMDKVIDENDPFMGTCARKDNFKIGVRPLCWFSPTDDFNNEGGSKGDNTGRAPFGKMGKVLHNNRLYY